MGLTASPWRPGGREEHLGFSMETRGLRVEATPVLGDTVDGINLATPRAPRGPKFKKFRFFMVLRVLGGPGDITNRRGMKKHARGLIFVNVGWIY